MISIIFLYTILDDDGEVMHTFASDKEMDKLSIAVEFAHICGYLFVWTNNSTVFAAQPPSGDVELFHFEMKKIRLFSEE